MLHIPILRKGNSYKSVDVSRVPHFRTRETFVEVSLASAGLIRRDLLDLDAAQAALSELGQAFAQLVRRHFQAMPAP